jgi:copper chaperone CopZ
MKTRLLAAALAFVLPAAAGYAQCGKSQPPPKNDPPPPAEPRPPGPPAGMPMPMPMPMPVPAPFPDPGPAPAPAPVNRFEGSVSIKLFAGLIATNGEEIRHQVDLPRFEQALKGVAGVTSVSFDESKGTLEVGYAGPIAKAGAIESAVASTGSRCALVSPAPVEFRPYDLADAAGLIEALKGVAGVRECLREGATFAVYSDLGVVNLKSLEVAAARSGNPGKVVSHELLSFRLEPETRTATCDAAGLARALEETDFVLRVSVDPKGSTLEALVVRGKVTRMLVKRVAARFGYRV